MPSDGPELPFQAFFTSATVRWNQATYKARPACVALIGSQPVVPKEIQVLELYQVHVGEVVVQDGLV